MLKFQCTALLFFLLIGNLNTSAAEYDPRIHLVDFPPPDQGQVFAALEHLGKGYITFTVGPVFPLSQAYLDCMWLSIQSASRGMI